MQEKETALQNEQIALAKALEQEKLAQSQKRIALEQEQIARRNLYVAHMNLAQTHWENANVSRVEGILDLYRRVEPGQVDLRGWEWHYQDRLCHAYLRTLRGHESLVLSVAFSPDGTRLASGCAAGFVTVWDVASGKGLRMFGRPRDGNIKGVAFNPDGTRVATNSLYQTVKMWDIATGRELRTFQEGGGHGNLAQTGLVFSPDGTRLAMGGVDQTVKVWDVASGQELRTFRGHNNWVTTVAFSPDGTRLASGGVDQTVKVWDVASGKGLLTFRGHNDWVTTVAFSPDGTRLASGSFDQTVNVWEVASDQEFRTLHREMNGVTVAFSPNWTRVALGSYKCVTISDAASGKAIRTLPGGVNIVVFSPDGTRLATGGSHDRSIRLWDVASGMELHTLQGPKHEVGSAEQINALANFGQQMGMLPFPLGFLAAADVVLALMDNQPCNPRVQENPLLCHT